MHTMQEQPPPWQVGALPLGWERTRAGLWINCADELFFPVRPALLPHLPWPQRARVVIVRHNRLFRQTFSYEARVVRSVLRDRSDQYALYDWVVRAVAPYAEVVRDDPEESVYSAVTDPAARLSVLMQVEER